MRSEPIVFNGMNLEISEEALSSSTRTQPSTAPSGAGGLFVPRTAAASKPRAGLGRARKPGIGASKHRGGGTDETQETAKSGGKGQDDFRKMLG